jgi:hypothetical protein
MDFTYRGPSPWPVLTFEPASRFQKTKGEMTSKFS